MASKKQDKALFFSHKYFCKSISKHHLSLSEMRQKINFLKEKTNRKPSAYLQSMQPEFKP
jgi:hypothetical protein